MMVVMTELRGEEKVAAATIACTLGLRVEQHDNGNRPGMHDLNIFTGAGRSAAVEVTAAADPDSIELWKLVNGRDERWIVPNLHGGWMVRLKPTARGKRLLKELPTFLAELEQHRITEIPIQRQPQEGRESLETRARILGIVSGTQSRTDFPGSIYLTIDQPPERISGAVDSTGSAVSSWVREFLMNPHQSDVLGKLARSGAKERHAFVLVPGLSSAPFGVVDMLWRPQDDVVPATPPHLPDEVTHVWLMTFWTVGSGLRWSPEGHWERFERQFRTK